MKNVIRFALSLIAIVAMILFPEIREFVFGNHSGVAMAMAGFVYTPLTWKSGNENMGGFKNRVLWIPSDSVKKVPLIPAKSVTEDDLITAAGAFEFKEVGNKPLFVYCTPKTVKYGAENQGEIDGQSFKNSGEFFHPGSAKEIHIFNRKINNSSGYLILEDSAGIQYMVGQPGMECRIKPSFDGGQNTTDRRGTKYVFEADSFNTATILGTPIDMDALINPPSNPPV